jgi:hypothetical protein
MSIFIGLTSKTKALPQLIHAFLQKQAVETALPVSNHPKSPKFGM